LLMTQAERRIVLKLIG